MTAKDSRVTRYLQLFDVLKDAVAAGDRETEESTYAALRQLLNELTQEERWEMSHPMITKYKELSEIYALAAQTARKRGDDPRIGLAGDGWEPNDIVPCHAYVEGAVVKEHWRNWERFQFHEDNYWRRRRSPKELP